MGDVTKTTYNESNLHESVLWQRGKVIIDFELNEMQDILRVRQYRGLKFGLSSGNLNPGSNDDGYLVEEHPTVTTNQVTVKAGWLICDGIPIKIASDYTLTGFTTPGGTRTDIVWVRVTQVEITDPAKIARIGETTKRLQLQVTLGITENSTAGAVTALNTVAEIWESGTRYFPIAEVTRGAGVSAITTATITDLRKKLPAYYLDLYVNGNPAWLVNEVDPVDNFSIPYFSLDKIVNGRLQVTVGDGVKSWGEVSGVHAITDAFTLAQAHPTASGITIFVKEGDYEIDATHYLGTGSYDVKIVGVCRDSCKVQVTDTTQDMMVIDMPGQLTLENLTLGNLGGGTATRINNDQGIFRAKNVTFQNVSVRVGAIQNAGYPQETRPVMILEHCSGISPSGAACVVLEPGGGSVPATTIRGIVFKECDFQALAGRPIVTIQPKTGTGAVQTLDGIVFERCRMLTSYTTDSGTNPAANVGVVDFNTNGISRLGGKAPLIVKSIKFTDCNVTATSDATAGRVRMLLRVLPVDTGSGAFTVGVTQYVDVRRFEISGGTWEVPNVDCIYAPFVVALYSEDVDTRVVIRDVHTGFQNSTTNAKHGKCGSDAALFFGTVASTTSQFGWMALYASQIQVRSSSLSNLTQKSDSGDLYLYATSRIDVDDFLVSNYVTGGSGTIPQWRGFVRAGVGLVKRLRFTGTTSPQAVNSDWCTQNADADLTSYGILTIYPCTRVEFEQCEVRDYKYTDGSAVTHRAQVSGGIALYNQTNTAFGTVILRRCYVDSCYKGIGYQTDTGSFTTQVLGELTLDQCEVTDNQHEGVYVRPKNLGIFRARNNRIYANGNATGQTGLYIKSDGWQTRGTVEIQNNSVYGNNTSDTAEQIEIETNATGRTVLDIPGVVMGNSCRNIAGTSVGQIYVRGNVPITVPANGFLVSELALRGLDTGYAGGADYARRKVISGSAGFLNDAVIGLN